MCNTRVPTSCIAGCAADTDAEAMDILCSALAKAARTMGFAPPTNPPPMLPYAQPIDTTVQWVEFVEPTTATKAAISFWRATPNSERQKLVCVSNPSAAIDGSSASSDMVADPPVVEAMQAAMLLEEFKAENLQRCSTGTLLRYVLFVG